MDAPIEEPTCDSPDGTPESSQGHLPNQAIPAASNSNYDAQCSNHEMLLKFYQVRMSECAAAYASAAAGAAWASAALANNSVQPTLIPTLPIMVQPNHCSSPFWPWVGHSYPSPHTFFHQQDPSILPTVSSPHLGDGSPFWAPTGPYFVDMVDQESLSNDCKTTKKQKRANQYALQDPSQNMQPNHNTYMYQEDCSMETNNANYTHTQSTQVVRKKKSHHTEASDRLQSNTQKNGAQSKKIKGTGSFLAPALTDANHFPFKNFHSNIQKPFDPIGKSAISALFELCHKRKWEPPKFIEISIQSTHCFEQQGISSSTNPLRIQEYNFSVELNHQEVGRGRGGTKKAAQQDAARKALSTFFPSILFNENGIIVGIGKESARKETSRFNRFQNSGCLSEECMTISTSDSQILEEHLAPKLASRLAINTSSGHEGFRSDPTDVISPEAHPPPNTVFVESSAGQGKSTTALLYSPTLVVGSPYAAHDDALSQEIQDELDRPSSNIQEIETLGRSLSINHIDKVIHEAVPLDLHVPVHRSSSEANVSLIDPSGSTLSAISSVSDEDEYYSSRGASICSALLHAISHIHSRVMGPPEFIYHTITSDSTSLLAASETPVSKKIRYKMGSPECWDHPRIPEKIDEKGYDSDDTSPFWHTDEVESTRLYHHRPAYSCKASVTVIEMNEGLEPETGDEMGFISSCEGIQDSQERGESKQLFTIGTGPTKRDAKHVASAKLLSLLFPHCHGILEVIRAAEDMRERYAAKKASSRLCKRSLVTTERKAI